MVKLFHLEASNVIYMFTDTSDFSGLKELHSPKGKMPKHSKERTRTNILFYRHINALQAHLGKICNKNINNLPLLEMNWESPFRARYRFICFKTTITCCTFLHYSKSDHIPLATYYPRFEDEACTFCDLITEYVTFREASLCSQRGLPEGPGNVNQNDR